MKSTPMERLREELIFWSLFAIVTAIAAATGTVVFKSILPALQKSDVNEIAAYAATVGCTVFAALVVWIGLMRISNRITGRIISKIIDRNVKRMRSGW